MIISGILKGAKAASLAVVLTAALIFLLVGAGTVIDLLAGVTPKACIKDKP